MAEDEKESKEAEAAGSDDAPPSEVKSKKTKEKPWMVWKGDEGHHTPPLPSRDLDEATVRLLVGDMQTAASFEATGLWELNIPDGGLRAKPQRVDQG